VCGGAQDEQMPSTKGRHRALALADWEAAGKVDPITHGSRG